MDDNLSAILKKFRSRGIMYSILFISKEIKQRLLRLLGISYSQRGEDRVLQKIFKNKSNGFYVDIGAYDPVKLSNTLKFYKMGGGWNGLNIEPQKANYLEFVKQRPRDINLNIGIGKREKKLDFFEMSPESLSTFSKEEAKECQNMGYKLKRISKVKVCRLDNTLSKYAKNKVIDFMTIDTEGYDMIVLESNDWERFRPKAICIESKKEGNVQERFLLGKGYVKYFDNGLNTIFILTS